MFISISNDIIEITEWHDEENLLDILRPYEHNSHACDVTSVALYEFIVLTVAIFLLKTTQHARHVFARFDRGGKLSLSSQQDTGRFKYL